MNRTGVDRRHDARRYGAGRRAADLRTRIMWRAALVTVALAWLFEVVYLLVTPHV